MYPGRSDQCEDTDMRNSQSRCLLGLSLALLILLHGCQSEENLLPEPVVHTPLAFDPLEEYEPGQWWTNGHHMLRLDEVGSYALYGGMNRYHPPLQHGRWSQITYAELRLEPYDVLPRPARRIQITRIEGKVVLIFDAEEPMYAIDHPPRVTEDELLGAWSCEQGMLVMSDDLRYVFSPSRDAALSENLVGHYGTWKVSGMNVTLHPHSPAVSPWQMHIQLHSEPPELKMLNMVFRRSS